jgi:Heavy metal associated domain 2
MADETGAEHDTRHRLALGPQGLEACCTIRRTTALVSQDLQTNSLRHTAVAWVRRTQAGQPGGVPVMAHEAHVSHHIPGRMRVKVPGAKGQPRMLQQIQQALAPMPGVQRVEVNPATGSVLIYYDPSRHEAFHMQLAAHGTHADLLSLQPPALTEVEATAATLEADAAFLASHSAVARWLIDGVKQLDTGVKRATSNTVDLQVLVPLGLALYAFMKAGTEAVTPLWVTLGISSFHAFVVLHSPHPGAPGEGSPGIQEGPAGGTPHATAP